MRFTSWASPEVQRTVQVRVRRLLAPHSHDIHILCSSHACEIVPRQVLARASQCENSFAPLKHPACQSISGMTDG